MKVYKGIIHPMLISREREIDDMIQLAQDYGYMQVFKLGSKSCQLCQQNYHARRKVADTNTMMMSHQLMKNISLSNISDAGTIQSNEDTDEILRMRRFSLDKNV
ncbi:hypothetical protein PVAND_013508 [Polypedilum vanderplanki]|uniref:Uncharacterized protein n=1 Tax=Polypedilum vanderplanki TaxID=319348 RepID=A0A9J6CQP7_POLVA|nr:hypothetical protein PVAND_013508 [Polypedilum vanderplanki]